MERSRRQRTQSVRARHAVPIKTTEEMTMRRLIKALLILEVCRVMVFAQSLGAGEAKSDWQAEWDRTVRAAEQEGQVMVSIGGYGGIFYSRGFLKNYPKNKKKKIIRGGTHP